MKDGVLYLGNVYHRRLYPKKHSFKYRVVYFYLNLDEVNQFPSLAPVYKFDHRDYMKFHTQSGEDIKGTVRRLIKEQTGKISEGPIRVLTQIRFIGFCFNPVSFYYCFDPDDTKVEYIVIEINNTPWNERKVCVFECHSSDHIEQFEYSKDFHVSPFMPMELTWILQFEKPDPNQLLKSMYVHMEDWDFTKEIHIFDATIELGPRPLTRINILRAICRNPLLTFKPFLAIYFQALILKLKKVPFYSHPNQEQK